MTDAERLIKLADRYIDLIEAASVVADALLTDDSGDTYTVPAEDMQRLRDALGCRQCCLPEYEHGIIKTHAFVPPPPESP